MKTKNNAYKLTDEAIARYRREAAVPDIMRLIAVMNRASTHHELFMDCGMPERALAAERAWIETGLVLCQTPAATAQEAHWKVGYLQACLEAWVIANARGRHENGAGMIMTAVEIEADRWNHPRTKPN